jgi:hypothetical protein
MSRHQDVITRIALTKVADLDALFAGAAIRRTVADFTPTYILAAMPKSSSTYTTRVLAEILGAQVYKDIVTQDLFTPKDLSLPGVLNGRNQVTVSQVHMIATGANLRITRHFGIGVALLVRNIFDVAISLYDHMEINPFFSSILIPHNYRTLSRERKLGYIIDTAIPWIMTFYTSWVGALERGDAETEFIRYEDLIREPVTYFREICRVMGCEVDDARVERALTLVEKSAENRINVGVSGRGREMLTAEQMDRIARHARYYPGMDFSLIGIDRNEH